MRTVLDGQTGIAMLLQDTLMGEMDKPKLSAGVMVLEPDSEKSRPQTATGCLALPCCQIMVRSSTYYFKSADREFVLDS